MQMNRRAFTLIELLTVLAIILLLAAIIFPVFARAKRSALQTKCISNLSQIGKAMLIYMGDHDDMFPRAVDASDKYAPSIWDASPDWQATIASTDLLNQALHPYSKGPEIYACPSDMGTRVLDNHFPEVFETSPSIYKQYGLSYFYRTEIAFRGIMQTALQDPARVNVLFDGGGHWHGSTPAVKPNDSLEQYLYCLQGFRYNTLFGDMHVKNLSRDQLDMAWATDL